MPLHQNPMAKATLAATGLAATSNVLAQLLEAHNKAAAAASMSPSVFSLDILQIVRFTFVIALTTPPNYLWQILLERIFPAYGPCPEDTDEAGDKGGDDQKHKKKKRTSSNADIDIEKQTPLSFQAPSSPPSPTSSTSGGSSIFSTPASSSVRRLNWRNTMTKWFIDCITLGALLNTLAFFILMGLLKNQPLSQIAVTVKEQTMPIILAGYRIWPLASIISFTVVPVEKRVVFMNFVGLLWGVYMSIIAARV